MTKKEKIINHVSNHYGECSTELKAIKWIFDSFEYCNRIQITSHTIKYFFPEEDDQVSITVAINNLCKLGILKREIRALHKKGSTRVDCYLFQEPHELISEEEKTLIIVDPKTGIEIQDNIETSISWWSSKELEEAIREEYQNFQQSKKEDSTENYEDEDEDEDEIIHNNEVILGNGTATITTVVSESIAMLAFNKTGGHGVLGEEIPNTSEQKTTFNKVLESHDFCLTFTSPEGLLNLFNSMYHLARKWKSCTFEKDKDLSIAEIIKELKQCTASKTLAQLEFLKKYKKCSCEKNDHCDHCNASAALNEIKEEMKSILEKIQDKKID